MAYSWGMVDQWLELRDGQETRNIPMAGSLTKIGGASPDVSMQGLPLGELHVWSDPPKLVMVAGHAALAVNGVDCREALLADGDRIEWGEMSFHFRREVSAQVLQEIPVAAPAPAPAMPRPRLPPSAPADKRLTEAEQSQGEVYDPFLDKGVSAVTKADG